jgi:hypothetical protein
MTASKVAVEFVAKSGDRAVLRIHFEFHDGPADFHPQSFLTRKNGLVLESRHRNDVDVPFTTIVVNVVMAQDQNGGFFTALKRLNNLLWDVTPGVGGAAAGVHHFDDSRLSTDFHFDVGLDVPNVNQILPAFEVGDELDVSADVEPRSEPAFVVVAGDVIGLDAFALWIVVHKIFCLAIDGRCQH